MDERLFPSAEGEVLSVMASYGEKVVSVTVSLETEAVQGREMVVVNRHVPSWCGDRVCSWICLCSTKEATAAVCGDDASSYLAFF